MQFKFLLAAQFSGLVFGIGLISSGMTNPAKVIGFLDIFGAWDASLMFVMVGAIFISFFAFSWAKKQQHSLLDMPMQLPTNQMIDIKLLTGAALFGIGWGLSGFCPGPAIVSLTTQLQSISLFLPAMVAGIMIYKVMIK